MHGKYSYSYRKTNPSWYLIGDIRLGVPWANLSTILCILVLCFYYNIYLQLSVIIPSQTLEWESLSRFLITFIYRVIRNSSGQLFTNSVEKSWPPSIRSVIRPLNPFGRLSTTASFTICQKAAYCRGPKTLYCYKPVRGSPGDHK